MHNGSHKYIIPALDGLFGKATLVKDADDDTARRTNDLGTEALARSGDYFVMLASRLDAISREAQDYEVRLQLENIVSDLIYLQDNYTLSKKER